MRGVRRISGSPQLGMTSSTLQPRQIMAVQAGMLVVMNLYNTHVKD